MSDVVVITQPRALSRGEQRMSEREDTEKSALYSSEASWNRELDKRGARKASKHQSTQYSERQERKNALQLEGPQLSNFG